MGETINKFEKKIEAVFPNVEQVKIDTVLGKKIIIRDAVEREGEFGVYNIILAEVEGKIVSFSCGSKAVNKHITKLKADKTLPVALMIDEVKGKKSGRVYYDCFTAD